MRSPWRYATHRRVFLWLPRYTIDMDLIWGRAWKVTYDDGRVEYSKR